MTGGDADALAHESVIAIEPGQLDVQDRDVRHEFHRALQRLNAGASFSDHHWSGFRISVWLDWTRKHSPYRYLTLTPPSPSGRGGIGQVRSRAPTQSCAHFWDIVDNHDPVGGRIIFPYPQ